MPKLIRFEGNRSCPTCDQTVSELYDMNDRGKGIRCYLCRTEEQYGSGEPTVYIPSGHYTEAQVRKFLEQIANTR